MTTDWEERARMQINAQRTIGQKGTYWDNFALGENSMRSDLDLDNERNYHLDKLQSDRLIVHARQDAAHALCNTRDLLALVEAMRWKFRALFGLQLVLIALILVRGN